METSTSKAKICGSTSKGIDRISALPDDVLHNILSSLFIFDVVQLSVLSKRWKYIWTTMPYLHFDFDKFYSERLKRLCNMEMTEKFKDFINWVLISQRATILSVLFSLSISTVSLIKQIFFGGFMLQQGEMFKNFCQNFVLMSHLSYHIVLHLVNLCKF